MVIIGVAIVVKLVLGSYVKKQGQKVNSGALVASGSDASFDAILSALVLTSALIYLIFDISLEAYVGLLISVFIIKAGVEMMLETLDDIIGKREDKEAVKIIDVIKNIVMSYDWALQMHGFYLEEEKKIINLDVLINFDIEHEEALKILYDEIRQVYPDYELQIVTDIDLIDM